MDDESFEYFALVFAIVCLSILLFMTAVILSTQINDLNEKFEQKITEQKCMETKSEN